MIINFNFYSFTYEEELSVEAEVEYKEPDYNDKFSDLDYRGGYDIMSIDVYHEDGELVTSTGHKQQLLDQEVRDKLNQHLRCMEIENSRYEANFGEMNSDTVYYHEGD
ncbi:hypothetical protein phiA019_0065 [Aeromonas phage phiA019]|nr:hypothetical protein phiA009_0069 [Aeromonas phage phiA009]ULG01602.1 hypothetical protein phiA019_0065 [Aeromonas phage phiA019]